MAIWSAMFWKLQVAESQCHAEGSQCESVLALATASASATDRPPWPVVKAMDGRGAHPQSRNPIPGAAARVSATRDHFSYRFCVLCRRFEAVLDASLPFRLPRQVLATVSTGGPALPPALRLNNT